MLLLKLCRIFLGGAHKNSGLFHIIRLKGDKGGESNRRGDRLREESSREDWRTGAGPGLAPC